MIWSDLYPRIRIHVPGCPDPIIETMLRETAVKFCRETKIWKETLNSVYPVNGVTRYQLELPEETEILSLESVIQGRTNEFTGITLDPTINVFGLMTFDAEPDPNQGLIEVTAILRPSDTSTGLPDRVGRDYETALIHGCVAALQIMPDKDWTNPQFVPLHESIYRNRLSEAFQIRATGGTEQPLRVKPFTSL